MDKGSQVYNSQILLAAILIGLIPAAIARTKGRSFIAWWLYGAALFIIALPHAIIMRRNLAALERQQLYEGMQKCPFCAELIKAEVQVCRYCQRDLSSASIAPPPGPRDLRCSQCAHLNPAGILSCEKCGHNLNPFSF